MLDCGSGKCMVEQMQNEDKVAVGEWFFTSGEDRIFPKGFPVGTVASSQTGQGSRDIKLNLSGAPGGVEEVLVVLEGIHQAIPAGAPPESEGESASMLPPPPAEKGNEAAVAAKPQTEADKVLEKYAEIGKQQEHVYGGLGSPIPNFNIKPDSAGKPSEPAAASAANGGPAKTGQPKETAKPGVAAPSATQTGILGARPVTKPVPAKPAPAETKPQIKTGSDSGPILPLGAPRHKTPRQPTATSTQAPANQE